MKTGSTNIRDIRKSPVNRIDCSFHLSDGIHVRQMIDELPFPKITCGEAASRIFHAGRWRRVYVDNPAHGITLLGSSSMLKADFEDEKMVSLKYTDDLEDKTLQAGWTLISCSGTIGKTAYTNSRHAGKLASQDVIRLKPNDILGGGYIYAYLSTRYGYTMLTQGTFGNVIQHIEPSNVSPIPIPVFPKEFQEKVDGMIKRSARLREEAADALDKAVKHLSSFINEEFESKSLTTSKTTIKDIRASLQCRLDPPAHVNVGVVSMKRVIKRLSTVPLSETNTIVRRPGIFKRHYVKSGYPYIKGSEIFNTNPFSQCEHISYTRTPFVDEMLLKEGQILITCAGNVGLVKMITKEYEEINAIGSQDIIRLESSDAEFPASYLFVYFQLPFVKDYIQSMKYGSVIERVEPFHIASIPIVKPSSEILDNIRVLIETYMKDSYQAYKNETDAIAMVEAEIEKWSNPHKYNNDN